MLELISARENSKATCMRLASALADTTAHKRSKAQHARLADELARALSSMRQARCVGSLRFVTNPGWPVVHVRGRGTARALAKAPWCRWVWPGGYPWRH